MHSLHNHLTRKIRNILALCLLLTCGSPNAHAISSWLFTSEHDLPNSLINDLAEDGEGNIWIATEDGLCKYDGNTFTTYRMEISNPHALANNLVRCLFVDNEKHLFVGTVGGLQLYRPETDDFSRPAASADGTLWPGNITQVSQSRSGELHVCGNTSSDVRIVEEGELELVPNALTSKIDLTQGMVEDYEGTFWICQQYKDIYRLLPDGTIDRVEEDGNAIISSRMMLGRDSTIYVGGERDGLFRYDRKKHRFVAVNRPDERFVVMALKSTSDGRMLVGTDGNGILEYDYATGTLKPYSFDSYQLIPSTQKVHAILEDSNHAIWLGLFQKGVVTTTPHLMPFRYIGHKTELHNSIGDKCVTSIYSTRDGNVWVSTDNGGVYCIDKEGNAIRQFPYGLGANGVPQAVLSMFEDSHGHLWFGSYHRGLGTIDRKSGRCSYVNVRDQQSPVNVYAFAEDDKQRLWAASMGLGLLLYDEKSHEMTSVCDNPFVMWSTSILFEPESGHLFIGSYNGLNEVDPDDPNYTITRHLESKIVHSITQYDRDILCVSTDSGLSLYNVRTHETQTFTTAEGLPSNAICAAVATSPNEIWLSCNYGLCCLKLPACEVSCYTVYDGLQSNEFYSNSVMAEEDGTIWFGGMEGITLFNPNEMVESQPSFKVRITQRTPYTIQMGVVPLLYTHRARYSYSLDNNDWITLPPGTNTMALPEIGYGSHTFRYRASVDGLESEEQRVDFFVPYPWYLSWWFKLICLLSVLAVAADICFHLYQRRRERKHLEMHERQEAINDAKLQFFTNISHEIRTPMTLIVSPLERLMEADKDPSHLHTYKLMQRNANRILGLINQLLDLRKIDKNQMQLLCAETELAPYLEDLVSDFSDVADMRQQSLCFSSTADPDLKGWVDVCNFDKIVVNLLSNALKYTPQNGTIKVSLSQQPASAKFPEGSFSIAVADSGLGIAPEDRNHIFERFYQVSNSKGKYGTGIGLHLTQTLVQLHHGTIEVEANPQGEGTIFTVTLPLGCSHLTAEQKTLQTSRNKEEQSVSNPDTSSIAVASISNEEEVSHAAKHSTRRHVLVVEDDDEIRTYICQQLSEYYYVSQCSNGREALDRILRQAPDLVISDVMMPEMNGNELCKSIRSNVLISHVPVILLTARTRQEDHIHGLEVGADAFLPKPFSIDVLYKTAQNVIQNHERLRNTYSGQQDQSSQVEIKRDKTPDERLMERINRVLNENISNPDLSAEMVASEVGLSRVHLYRKLKELTNQSARDYIRNMRMMKAAELLREQKTAIGEVSYKVGYTDQRNFSTAFKSIYGMTPSEYMGRREE